MRTEANENAYLLGLHTGENVKTTTSYCMLALIDLHAVPSLSKDASANRVPRNISKGVGKRFRELCRERGIASSHFDAALGLNLDSVRDLESGKVIISTSKLAMIALSLNLTMSELLK